MAKLNLKETNIPVVFAGILNSAISEMALAFVKNGCQYHDTHDKRAYEGIMGVYVNWATGEYTPVVVNNNSCVNELTYNDGQFNLRLRAVGGYVRNHQYEGVEGETLLLIKETIR